MNRPCNFIQCRAYQWQLLMHAKNRMETSSSQADNTLCINCHGSYHLHRSSTNVTCSMNCECRISQLEFSNVYDTKDLLAIKCKLCTHPATCHAQLNDDMQNVSSMTSDNGHVSNSTIDRTTSNDKKHKRKEKDNSDDEDSECVKKTNNIFLDSVNKDISLVLLHQKLQYNNIHDFLNDKHYIEKMILLL